MSDKQTQSLYESKRFFALAIDPIHVGTGGDRLGRVDMSIVREPGTNLPKIPGTTLAGACRTYAAMQEEGKFPQCAGQGQGDKSPQENPNGAAKGHCGEPTCPICVTFGFVKAKQSFQGLAQIFDAGLVFFPVHSLAGSVWVTCPAVLCDLGIQENEPDDNQVRVADGLSRSGKLNLGWLMLKVAGNHFSIGKKLSGVPNEIEKEIEGRAVLVPSKLFSYIVNDNLEVRTSVSIDPSTGAAADGALFTYEAIPRSAVLAFDVVFNDPKFYCIGGNRPLSHQKCADPPSQSDQDEDGLKKVKQTVENGFALFKDLGVGGMVTRGMGRLQVLGLNAATMGSPTSTEAKK